MNKKNNKQMKKESNNREILMLRMNQSRLLKNKKEDHYFQNFGAYSFGLMQQFQDIIII